MDGGEWLNANGLPGLISDFERVVPIGAVQPFALGNPVTGWMVRAGEPRPVSAASREQLEETITRLVLAARAF